MLECSRDTGEEMPGWTACGKWMHFAHLDGGNDLDGAYTFGYRITDDASDPWTARFNRFKAKDGAAIAGGVVAIKGSMSELLGAFGVKAADATFVPALGSGETKAAASGPLAVLAGETAKATGAQFTCDALSKKAHQPIHGIFDAGAREAELDKAEYVSGKISTKTVFVFDDLITRGSTLNRIARAIKAANPGTKVSGVALAKTERRAFWGTLTNDHVAGAWNDAWSRGEQKFQEWQKAKK